MPTDWSARNDRYSQMIIYEERDQQLAAQLGRLRRRWLWILEGACACAAVALVVSLFLPKIYRATTYVLVSESKIGAASKEGSALQVAMLPTFTPFVDNDTLITQSLQKLHLDTAPYNLTLDRFRKKGYLDVRIPKSTRLLEVNVEFPDPHLAADLANDLASGAVAFNDRMNVSDTESTQTFLKRQLDAAVETLSQAEARLVKIQAVARIEDREAELATLLAEKNKLAEQIQALSLESAQSRSKAASLQQALAAEPQTVTLKKSVTSDRFLEAAAERLDPQAQPLSMTEESPNKNREEMRRDFVDATVSGAAASAGIQTSEARTAEVNKQILELTGQLTILRSELRSADQNSTLAAEAVKNANREYQAASITVTSKSQDMKQISPAAVPERPVRPGIVLNTGIGFLLGALVSAGIALLIQDRLEIDGKRPHFEALLSKVGSNAK
jgi:polysaccharide biosynthesis transport protein